VTVSGSAGWELRFDAASGSLASWTGSGGRQLLAAPLAPCLYRAPTDNDKGGSGGSSYAARWAGWAGGVMSAIACWPESAPAASLEAQSAELN
jgi:beta-galactosidase